MFFTTPLIGAAALLSGFTAALPHPSPDSAIGEEVAVSAPNGIIMSDTAALASQTSTHNTWSTATWTDSSSADTSSTQFSWTASAPTATSTWTSSSASYSDQVVSYSSTSSVAMATSSTWSGYGSGSSNWNSDNYNNCVQQCVASFGQPSATYTPPTATGVTSSGSSGSGATHTVIVAPTQGVLRFVPFALNASVGDTVKFIWGANNHTVTKSSSLTPCNKTADKPFGSGEQNKGFVFTQVVNDTGTTFFYCGTPNHCEQGMFGIINPPSANNSSTSAATMMAGLAANRSDVAAYAAYVSNQATGNSQAANWGSNMDMSTLPTWAHSYAAENIMYTRAFLSLNKDMNAANMTLPKDFSVALNSTGATSSTTSLASPSSSSISSAPSSASMSSAAVSASLSKVLLGLVVGFATFMML